MPYRLILSDIDGTLLNSDRKLLPSTDRTIRELVKSGLLFATVSARTIPYTKTALSGLMKKCCANAYVNGAYIETSDGEVLVDKPIENEDVSLLLEHLDNIRASYCFISKNDAIAKILNPDSIRGFIQHHGKFSEKNVINENGYKTYLIAVEAKDLEEVVAVVKRNKLDLEFTPIVKSHISELEVTFFQRKGTNKEAALRAIAGHYGIDLADTISFGDSNLNDAPMIESAGCGVAMKNAHEALLEKADRVTKNDIDEDGLGDFLRKMFNL